MGLDLAKDASCLQPFTFEEGLWRWPEGYAKAGEPKYEVVVWTTASSATSCAP